MENLKNCINACVVKLPLGGNDSFYYDNRFGTKLETSEIHILYRTPYKYNCTFVKQVTHFMRVDLMFHLVVKLHNGTMEQCDVTYDTEEHCFTNRTHDPSVVIPAILTNLDFREFFISKNHPYFRTDYIANYKQIPIKRPVRMLNSMPSAKFYSDLINENARDMGIEPDIVYDVDDVDGDVADAWDTLDSLRMRENWDDLPYISDVDSNDSNDSNIGVFDSYDSFNDNGFDEPSEQDIMRDQYDQDNINTDQYTNRLKELDTMNNTYSPKRVRMLRSSNLMHNKYAHLYDSSDSSEDSPDSSEDSPDSKYEYEQKTTLGTINAFNAHARADALSRMMRRPLYPGYNPPTYRYQMRPQPQQIVPEPIVLPKNIPKLMSRENNLIDDVAAVIDFDVILKNILGNRLIAISVKYKNGEEKKELCTTILSINTPPAVNIVLTPGNVINKYGHESYLSIQQRMRMRMRMQAQRPVYTPQTYMRNHTTSYNHPTRHDNISDIRTRVSQLNARVGLPVDACMEGVPNDDFDFT